MIYLKQVKLLDPDLVAGNPEELKYPYKAPAVRFTESFIFRKPVTFLVGENGDLLFNSVGGPFRVKL